MRILLNISPHGPLALTLFASLWPALAQAHCPTEPADPAIAALIDDQAGQANINFDPQIAAALAQVSADSMLATIEHLVAYGTRYAHSESLVVAESWLESRFRSFGGYDPVMEPVNWIGERGLVTRHNVYVELESTGSHEEWVVIGGHHDSVNWNDDPSVNDPYAPAPGADDNGSGTAAVLEMARISAGIELPRTLRFTTFTIEERGLVGADRMARNMNELNQAVRLMINLDMIAHDPQALGEIAVSGSGSAEANLLREVVDTYTTITPVVNGWGGGSDHWAFFTNGHPAAFFIENDFNIEGWHHSSDLLWRMDLDYCVEVARAGFACALIAAAYPAPVETIALDDPGTGNSLVADWPHVPGAAEYKLRWGAVSGEPTEELIVADTTATLSNLVPNELVYLSVVAVDAEDRESWWAPEVMNAPVTLDGGILLVDETIDANPAEAVQDSLFDVYLAGVDYQQVEVSRQTELNIADLGAYSAVLWFGDDPADVAMPTHADLLRDYCERGGNLVISGWTQIGALAGGVPGTFLPGTFGHDLLGIAEVSRAMEEDFSGAEPLLGEYAALSVWDRYWPDNTMPMVEALEPAAGADELLAFVSASGDTAFDGHAVALRNRGEDGAGDAYTIGAPLLFMQPQGVRLWFLQVLAELGIPVGIDNPGGDAPPATVATQLRVHPNPFNPRTTVSFSTNQAGQAKVTVLDLAGRLVVRLLDRQLPAGRHSVPWDGTTAAGRPAASSVYLVLLETPQGRSQERMVLLK